MNWPKSLKTVLSISVKITTRLTIFICCSVLSGCMGDVHVGPLSIPTKQEGSFLAAPSGLSSLNQILVKYQDGDTVKTAQLKFDPQGIIKGKESPMIPLNETKSNLSTLGIKTNISIDGRKAELSYNNIILSFQEKSNYLYKNSDESIALVDQPLYTNGTLYVPLISILQALNIQYTTSTDSVVIGGAYTDDSRATSSH